MGTCKADAAERQRIGAWMAGHAEHKAPEAVPA
jgi:hypothetical protein